MYKKNCYKIIENIPIAKNTFRMLLSGDTQYITAPGQFVNIELEGKYLRRPISVCDYDSSSLMLIYKTVGEGTEQMSAMPKNSILDLLTGLGNGFNVSKCGNSPLLVGGGVGVPPLFNLAKKLIERGKTPIVALGFGSADEIILFKEFSALGIEAHVATVDGSFGTKGFVTDVICAVSGRYDYTYSCGPLPMLKAVYDACPTDGQFSFEERMGCGFGACMGCSCKTKYGNKRICIDGPILEKGEIIW